MNGRTSRLSRIAWCHRHRHHPRSARVPRRRETLAGAGTPRYTPSMRTGTLAAAAACLLVAGTASAQFGRGFFGTQVADADDFDGQWHYCRVMYRSAFDGGGGSWTTDYPNADINMSIRLSELTKTRVSVNAQRRAESPARAADRRRAVPVPARDHVRARGARCIDGQEAATTAGVPAEGRHALGGRLLGQLPVGALGEQIRGCCRRTSYPIIDVPLDHPLFTTQFVVTEIPQIPNIGFFLRSGGGTSEHGRRQRRFRTSAASPIRPAGSWC